jgi:branched-chain amino acid transport system permease protein
MPLGLSLILGVIDIVWICYAEPINQLLVTGGALFLLQALATVSFGVEFRSLGVRLPVFSIGDMNLSLSRIIGGWCTGGPRLPLLGAAI